MSKKIRVKEGQFLSMYVTFYQDTVKGPDLAYL